MTQPHLGAADLAARIASLRRHSASARQHRSAQPPETDGELATLLGLADLDPTPLSATLTLPGHEPCFEDVPNDLPPRLRSLLRAKPGRLFSHQAAVARAVAAGRHVVLATPTASGKSLAFLVPTLAHLEREPRATALALFPTKALAYDQLERLRALDAELGIGMAPSVYDGDTPESERRRIKESSRFVVTNPHGLNLYLGWHEGWRRLLANLSFVIVDETHVYTGALGGAVAWLLRRLRRLATAYGSTPRFIGASGTVANPAEHFARLIDDDVTCVDVDGSAQPPRTIALIDATRWEHRSPLQVAALVTRRLARARYQVVAFSNSRSQAELLARLASDRATRVEPYRAGYSPTRRRALEAALRGGQLRAISTTSALELGVDIGTVDAVVLNGFPGSIASLLQRIGRAGRSGQRSLGVVVLGAEPAARAILADPHGLLTRPAELAIANVDQPSVVRRGLELAASERPLLHDELARWGPVARSVANELIGAGVLSASSAGLARPGTRPHRWRPLLELEPTWEVHFEGTRTPMDPERVPERQALREAYRGAILLHGGQSFRVVSVDHERRLARARHEPDRSRHTQAGWYRAISPTRQRAVWRHGSLALELADAVLIEHVTTTKEFAGSTLVAQRKVVAPASRTEGEVLQLRFGRLVDPSEVPALHGTEHLLTKALPVVAIGAGDITGVTVSSPEPTLSLFAPDTIGGGTMLSAVASALPVLLGAARRILARCGCRAGCPFCTLDPRCDEPVADKQAVASVLERLERQATAGA